MEWKVLRMDKTIESTFESDLEPEALITDLNSSTVEGEEPIGYFFYNEGLFEELTTTVSDTSNLRVLANDDHYARLLAESAGA
jgi:hypothetical protein